MKRLWYALAVICSNESFSFFKLSLSRLRGNGILSLECRPGEPMRLTLPPTVTLLWDALRRPRIVFASITDGSLLSSALLWIVTLGILAGITGTFAAIVGKTSYGQDWWRELPIGKAVGQSVWFCLTDVLWASLLTWAIARLARATLRFDVLLTVLSLAAAPCLFTTLLFPMRDTGLAALYLWQCLNVVVILWASYLTCLGVQTCCQTSFGKAAQCSLPALLILGTIGHKAQIAQPTNFRAACHWEIWEGKHVRVFTLPGKSPKDISVLAHGLDELTEKDCALLNEAPLNFKIDFFCFNDDAQQRHFAGSEEEPENTAHTFWDAITLSYDTWDNLQAQMAHEICHVLLANRLSDKVHGLLDEGLCEYIAHVAVPDSDTPMPLPASPLPLRTLARSDVFFDWDQLPEEGEEDEEAEWKHYRSAESLTEYLVQHEGMDKFKMLYRRFARYGRSKDPDNDEGKQLSHAVQDVYKLSLRQLETQWRAAAAASPGPAKTSTSTQ